MCAYTNSIIVSELEHHVSVPSALLYEDSVQVRAGILRVLGSNSALLDSLRYLVAEISLNNTQPRFFSSEEG